MLWVYKTFWHFFIMCGKKIFQLFQNTFPHMAKSEFGSLQNLRLNWNIKYINYSIIWNCSYQKITYFITRNIKECNFFKNYYIFGSSDYISIDKHFYAWLNIQLGGFSCLKKSKYWWKPLFAYFLRPSKLNFLQSIDSS